MRTMILFLVLAAANSAASGQKSPLTGTAPGAVLGDSVHEEWVATYASCMAPSSDYKRAMVVDPYDRSIYVTGRSGSDILTVKYSPSADTLWIARYDGVGNSTDDPAAIAIDSSGNIVVTGTSYADHRNAFVTVKYSSSGIQQWVALYAGPRDSSIAKGVAVDRDGNIYVTGSSAGLGTMADFATVKYNSTGVEQWTARYEENWSDEPIALTLDDSANVYVTGSSESAPGDDSKDYATIKYSPAGVQQWCNRFNGPSNVRDVPAAMTCDRTGIYVTGSSSGMSRVDIATVKYTLDGSVEWIQRYNGSGTSSDKAVALALDRYSNLYVIGQADGSYVTIKYTIWGSQYWAARYGDPSSGYMPSGIAITSGGYAYVTGVAEYGYATLKYDGQGRRLQSMRYQDAGWVDSQPLIAVDGSDNIYVLGGIASSGTGADFLLIKYAFTGGQLWSSRYDGIPTSIDQARDIAVDHAGNVYVTGRSIGRETQSDYATLKYNSFGILQWTARYNGVGNSEDDPSRVTTDPSGNVFVIGKSNSDVAAVKYNPSGMVLWVARHSPPSGYNVNPAGLFVDRLGNLYVACNESYQGVVLKYNPFGVLQWLQRFDSFANALAVDDSGNVFVASGSYWGPLTDRFAQHGMYSKLVTDSTCMVIKFNAAGTMQWEALHKTGTGYMAEYINAISLDRAGNVYVAGTSDVGIYTSKAEYLTIKYDALGHEVWGRRYMDPDSLDNEATSIALDASGNVYVTGWSDRFGWPGTAQPKLLTIKYSPSGAQEWVTQCPAYWSGTPTLSLDAASNVFVAGTFYSPETRGDFITVKYSTQGNQQWVARYNGPGNTVEVFAAMKMDESGNIHVTGTRSTNDWSVFTTVKYSQTLVDVKEATPLTFALEQNYPNPFNPSTTIQFTIPVGTYGGASPAGGRTSLRMYDVLGREVTTLVNEVKQPGTYTAQWDASSVASGIYFYRLTAGSFVETKKCVLMK